MGSKTASRKAVETAGVRVVPGSPDEIVSLEEARDWGRSIGFPLLIKASAGGGGKGMRVVRNEDDLDSAFRAAAREAQSSFGDSSVYIERYLEKPRHIEIQVLLDQEGNGIHLGERECSIQRRYQKLVEESPSPVVDEEFREQLGAAALKVAQAAGYYNAGTVEFLVEELESGELRHYFLEMNTRLQVEHPVTELVTGLDLVREQILIASGQPLRKRSNRVNLEGAAIECRIYAEDPSQNFFPSPGVISTLFEPSGPGVRNDSGVCAGFEIPLEYDPLISKLVTFGADRSEAISRMRRALSEYKVGGVKTTIPFFQRLLSHPAFLAGELNTHFIEDHGLISDQVISEHMDLPAIAGVVDYFLRSKKPSAVTSKRSSAWKDHGREDWW
jgi:acetyl-CoA carboxylase biotin carboxylase subunit